jgi:hypothetical protein
MVCNSRRLLDQDVMSAAHHLEMRLKEEVSNDSNYELGEVKSMAQELVDALKQLWTHEETHGCNPDIPAQVRQVS